MGYLPAVLALSGSTSGFIRFASYVPLWSPFVNGLTWRYRKAGLPRSRSS